MTQETTEDDIDTSGFLPRRVTIYTKHPKELKQKILQGLRLLELVKQAKSELDDTLSDKFHAWEVSDILQSLLEQSKGEKK